MGIETHLRSLSPSRMPRALGAKVLARAQGALGVPGLHLAGSKAAAPRNTQLQSQIRELEESDQQRN